FGNGLKVVHKNTVGINENNNSEHSILLYPNPVDDEFRFKTATGFNVTEINIYDIQGQRVISMKNKDNVVNVSSLKSGIYIIQFISNDSDTFYKRIVK
ncbi:MAG: T9SS type A sorting domain-containing protein, partial [Saprospiraceae bacterium]|nr:T9SS type A sorting domain-containing protein [Saprospiraceae bacterium]